MRDLSSKVQDAGPVLHGDDWLITILHRRGVDFAYAVAYFESGGLTEGNKRRAMELGAALRALNMPYAVAADYNMTPEEATECGLASLLGGTTWQVPNVTYTCTSGQGRVLDFWIISETARWYMENPRIVIGTPWKPHNGIAFDLVALATLVIGNMLISGRAILNAQNKTVCEGDPLIISPPPLYTRDRQTSKMHP